MIKKLRLKFICINMSIVTAMLAVIFSLVIVFMGMGMEQQWQKMMEHLADNAIHSNMVGIGRMEERRLHFVVRLGKDGSILAVDTGYFENLDKEMIQKCVETVQERHDGGILKEQQLRYQVVPAPFGKMLIFADISGEIRTMQNLILVSILISIVSFGVFLMISIRLARWAVLPVETAWNQQRQFIADASHELKTPLTVIMTNAELLQSEAYDPKQQGFATSILTMSRQMRGLVESLLELARVDDGLRSVSFTETDFSLLAEEALLPFEPVYFERDLILQSEIESGIRVRGSENHLRQVLEILLDNGAKYATNGKQVCLKLNRQGNSCLLSLATPGCSMKEEELEQIFERFYRADKARAMDRSYGLGLSIARGIVQEHGGKIWAESKEGTNTFFVQLPVLS